VIGMRFPKPITGDVEEFQKSFLTLRRSLLRRHLAGDVTCRASVPDEPTIFCEDRHSARLNPETTAVRVACAIDEIPKRFLRPQGSQMVGPLLRSDSRIG